MTGKNKNRTAKETATISDREIVLLEDLPPKKDVKGGSARSVFGAPNSEPSPAGHNPDTVAKRSGESE